MNHSQLNQIPALVRREVLEHPSLFISAPLILGALLAIGSLWLLTVVPSEQTANGVEYLSILFDGLSPVQMAPIFMLLAIPFIIVLSVCGIVYLLNTLFQDRRDGSVLFWQSMPVSNLSTVLSKVLTLGAVVPLFYIATLFVLYLFTTVVLAILGLNYGVQVAGLGYMLGAAVVSLLLVYLSTLAGTLWLLPSIGWILLFSAFAKRTPLLWAIGVFILLLFVEDFVFGSQFLANWVESRSDPSRYLITDFSSVFGRFFNYEMFFGVAIGSILIAGAVYMRRFVD